MYQLRRYKVGVSILSQLRCWEQPLEAMIILLIHFAFQSSPSLGAGSNGKRRLVRDNEGRVSILSQLRCWEQRDRGHGHV